MSAIQTLIDKLRYDAKIGGGFADVSSGDLEMLFAAVSNAAELERRRSALASCASWLERWAKHVGNCAGGAKCTCGLTAVSFEANAALADAE